MVLSVNVGLMMVPALSILVPLYSLLSQMHALNTYWGIILVMVTSSLPLAVFLYSSFMQTLPVSVEEAARIDGANLFQSLFYVVIPMLKPVTATVGDHHRRRCLERVRALGLHPHDTGDPHHRPRHRVLLLDPVEQPAGRRRSGAHRGDPDRRRLPVPAEVLRPRDSSGAEKG